MLRERKPANKTKYDEVNEFLLIKFARDQAGSEGMIVSQLTKERKKARTSTNLQMHCSWSSGVKDTE